MLLQWHEELEDRFGMVFQILDKEYIARVRQERGYGVNPWTTHTRFLVSHRLLIDETYTATLRDWLGDFRAGSLLILDEAHHAAPSSGAKYASIRRSPGPSVTWQAGSSTGSSFRPPLITGTRIASPHCSKSSTPSASAGASRSGPRKSSTP